MQSFDEWKQEQDERIKHGIWTYLGCIVIGAVVFGAIFVAMV